MVQNPKGGGLSSSFGGGGQQMIQKTSDFLDQFQISWSTFNIDNCLIFHSTQVKALEIQGYFRMIQMMLLFLRPYQKYLKIIISAILSVDEKSHQIVTQIITGTVYETL